MKTLAQCLFLLLIFLAGIQALPAQSRTTIELMPQLAWNGELNERWGWSLNTSLESGLFDKTEGMPADNTFTPHTYNFQAGLAYHWGNGFDLSAGYQFGWRDLDDDEQDIEHRPLQQLSWAQRLGKYRVRLRARTEQRFFRSNGWQARHRWRLRSSLDLPLQGERLDPGETYLNAQSEWLANVFEDGPLFYRETRLYMGLGWLINDKYRLENGIEWRTRRSDAENNRRQRLIYRLTLSFH